MLGDRHVTWFHMDVLSAFLTALEAGTVASPTL